MRGWSLQILFFGFRIEDEAVAMGGSVCATVAVLVKKVREGVVVHLDAVTCQRWQS